MQDHLSKLTIQLILKEPFYGHLLTGLVKEVSDKVSTLSVSLTLAESLKLWVNPGFWLSIQDHPERQYGLLKHEILHLVFKHLISIRHFENKKIYNIAADLVVNQYLTEDQLPSDAITLNLFADLNLKKEAGVGYYYQQLLKAWHELTLSKKIGLTDSHIALQKLILEGHPHLEKHRLWEKTADQFSQAETRVIEGMLKEFIGTVLKRVGGKDMGHLLGSLKSHLKKFQAAPLPQINWRRILRIFASNSSQTILKNTIRKPSKRYATIPGIKIKHRTRVLIAIDTSGSIHLHDFDRFFNEVYHIWRQDTEIRVVECDVRIQRDYYYKGQRPELITGRGGTDFNAPIAFANQTYHPDAIIYFTDGFGPTPHTPSRYPILWMITSTGISTNTEVWRHLPGRKVKMNLEPQNVEVRVN